MMSPSQLSPVAIDSSPGELPFGLSWDDFAAALPSAARGHLARVSHVTRGRHRGGHPSVIITVSWEASATGQRGERTLFVKLNSDKSRETQAYRYLARHGVDVPELVACVDRDADEVLVLEFLPSIGVGRVDADDLLRLVAKINSLGSAADIPPLAAGRLQDEFEVDLARTLAHVSGSWPAHGADAWLDLYRSARQRYRLLPHALTHGELAAQQVGRTEAGRLVVFDLATLGERPRLADLANLLSLLCELTGSDERSVLASYLVHLGAAGGQILTVEDTWTELRLTRFVQEIEALPWRVEIDDDAELDSRLEKLAAECPAIAALLTV